MFSNFVYFKEVTKLSSTINYNLTQIHYSDNIIKSVYWRRDFNSASQILHLIEDTRLLNIFISLCEDKKWLELLLTTIIEKDISNIKDDDNLLLLKSCEYGFYDFVKYLSDIGFSDNFAVNKAIRYGNLDIVKYLATSENITFDELLEACVNGHIDVVEYIIKEHHIDVYDEDGRSEMFVASAKNGHIDLVRYFLDFIGDKLDKNQNSDAMDFAQEIGHQEVVNLLLENGFKPYNYQEDNSNLENISMITNLVKERNIDKVKEILKYEPIPHPAMRQAILLQDLDFVKLFLETNSDFAFSSLIKSYVGKRQNLDILKCFLDHNSNISFQDIIPWTDGIKFLLSIGKKMYNKNCFHAFLTCVKYHDLETIKLFAENGVNVGKEKNLAITYAAERGDLDIFKYLLKKRNSLSLRSCISSLVALDMNRIEIIKYLIEIGFDINFRNGTLLKQAHAIGNVELVNWLIDNGAKIPAINE